MKRCAEIDALVTPYVDGEVGLGDREEIGRHLEACPPCRRGAAAEHVGRRIVRDHAVGLMAEAPAALRARCRMSAPHRRAPMLLRRVPLAMAATLVLAVAGALFYSTVVNPAVAVAAQLTLDHLKCFTLFEEPAGLEPAAVRESLKARYGWDIAIPAADAVAGLSLVGGRRCVYLDGSVVHLLYKHGPTQVSVFVLPAGEQLPAGHLEALGHSAVGFERGGRTWVVLARESPDAMTKLAAMVKAAKTAAGPAGDWRTE
jgi:anti-sigma factor RsiW